ncbi:MAG: DNA polymerase III subunit alpha [Gammaproteobacteria bacterium]
MNSSFVHLALHSEYSIVDGLVRVNDLGEAVAAGGMAAVAITDHCNLFAAVKFYRAMLKKGIKPIIGCDVLVKQQDKTPHVLRLLAQNPKGYNKLTCLVSRAYKEGQEQGVALVHPQWLTPDSCEGLIALSGGLQGTLAHTLLADNTAQRDHHLQHMARCFPHNFYIELVRTGHPQDMLYGERALPLAQEKGLPVVATNNVRFLKQGDFDAHEARVCINQGVLLSDPQRHQAYSEQQYLRSAEEMKALFSDIPEAITNTVEIAKRCSVILTLGESYLPGFTSPEGLSEAEQLKLAAKAGLEKRFEIIAKDKIDKQWQVPYNERLERELSVINAMGFPGYFLIVADFIHWAKHHDVPVGPGRGSGAGSLVAYALEITDLDPLKYDLLFERFLNPERVSMPDFDIDFCMDGRDRVIDYVAQRYGRDCVAQIITYGTMAAKAVVRDVGRVLAHPYGFVDKIAKLIPFEIGMTLDKALEQEEVLLQRYNEEEEVKELIDLAKKLEGITRNAGKHAGGVVIAPTLLTDFTSLYYEEDSDNPVTQFDKDDVETVGLVKFDFLGLRTLTIIHWAVQTINKRLKDQGKEAICIDRIPLQDEATFDLLKACKTTAVFQLESRGMKDLVHRLQPDCFEEIIALVALFRPGPLQSGMVDDFINRKHGYEAVEYLHPDLEPILQSTYGVILYQEQVMQIAQVLAGYSLGAADLLRRAMGKKKPEEMAKQRKIFMKGAVERGLEKNLATTIFDLMEKFAGYGFNKSHSAAYALVAYQTAWLKAHYPAEFMAAVLSSDMDNTDKVVNFIEDCKAMDLTVLPPDINVGEYRFIARDNNTVSYGLGAIKGVGEGAVVAMVEERQIGGDFDDLFTFCQRIDLKKANRRTLEALVRAGALDKLGEHRASLFSHLEAAVQGAEQAARDAAAGQNDLFGGGEKSTVSIAYKPVKPWRKRQLLQGEKETLGYYFSGHPIAQYEEELNFLKVCNIGSLQTEGVTHTKIAGFIMAMRTMNTKRGDRMAFLSVDDNSGRMEVAVFSDVYQGHRDLLQKDQLVVIEGEVDSDEYSGGLRMSANRIYSMEQARTFYGRYMAVHCGEKTLTAEVNEGLVTALTPYRGGKCPVHIHYKNTAGEGVLRLGEEWCVHPSDDMMDAVVDVLGEGQVKMVYNTDLYS